MKYVGYKLVKRKQINDMTTILFVERDFEKNLTVGRKINRESRASTEIISASYISFEKR